MIGFSTGVTNESISFSIAVFVQYDRYLTAVLYHHAGINGLHQREADGCLMCAKGSFRSSARDV